jgi:hypothetical protein
MMDETQLKGLLEECYRFLADNTHEAEEDAAELMGKIEEVLDIEPD